MAREVAVTELAVLNLRFDTQCPFFGRPAPLMCLEKECQGRVILPLRHRLVILIAIHFSFEFAALRLFPA